MAIRFGPFRLVLSERRLSRGDEAIEVQDQVLEVLAALTERPGGLWTREELHHRLWPDAIVSEDALFQAVAKTRRALGDSARRPRYIATVPGRGYRFLANVDRDADRSEAPAAAVEMPRPATSFVGRQAALEELLEALSAEPGLWTLTGPGGMGKTRLSLELAQRFAAGAAFCDLQSAGDLGAIWTALGRGLHVSAQLLDDPRALAGALSDRGPLLVVLDNGEQVVEELAHVVSRLLAAAPLARVLVTSRIRLGLGAERLVELAPLDLPAVDAGPEDLASSPAGALLLDRARTSAGWRPAPEDHGALVALTRSLGGLPLAIELAAPRLRLLGPAQLLARMDRQLDLLGGRAPDRPSRHATLRSAIGASWELLDVELQRALAQLSVFPGPFSVGIAEATLELKGLDSFLALAELVDHSLVRRRQDRPERPLLEVLPSIRAFAGAHLDASQRAEALDRLADAHAEAARHPGPEDLAVWQAGQERDSLLVALERAVATRRSDVAAAIAGSLCSSLLVHGPLQEVRTRLAPVLSLPGLSPADRSRLLLWEAEARLSSTDVDAAGPLLDEVDSLEVPELAARRTRLRAAWLYRCGDVPAVREALRLGLDLPHLPAAERARMLLLRAQTESFAVDSEAAIQSLEEARRLVEALDLRALRVELLYELGCLQLSFVSLEAGRALLEESMALARTEANPTAAAKAQAMLGRALMHLGRREEAAQAMTEAAPVLRRAGLMQELGTLLDGQGLMAANANRLDEAAQLLGEAIALLEAAGQVRSVSAPRNTLATVWLRLGQYDEAEACFLEILEVFEQQGRNPGMVLHNLGEIDRLRGNLGRARERLRAAQLAQAAGGKFVSEAMARITLGEIELADQQPRAAVEPLQLAVGALRVRDRKDMLVLALANLGLALGWSGEAELAEAAFAEGRELTALPHLSAYAAMILARQAQVAHHQGAGARARGLLDQAREAAGEPPPPDAAMIMEEAEAQLEGR